MKIKSKKITLCAIFASLSLVIMYLGSILDIMDLTAAALASMLVYLSVIELGGYYPYALWLICSVLGIIILPTKTGVLCYGLFAGIYPMFKLFFDRMNKILAWILKLSMFNTALIILMILAKRVFMTEFESVTFTWIFAVLGNVTFVLYDIAMTKLLILYTVKLRTKFKIDKFLKK